MIKPSNSSLILFHVIANCLSQTTTEQSCTLASLSCRQACRQTCLSRSGSIGMIHCLSSVWTLLPAQHLTMQQQCQDPAPAHFTVFFSSEAMHVSGRGTQPQQGAQTAAVLPSKQAVYRLQLRVTRAVKHLSSSYALQL